MNVNLLLLNEAPDPDQVTILTTEGSEVAGDYVFFQGDGHMKLMCGGCGRKLVDGTDSAGRFRQMVFRCPGCSRFSQTRT